MFSLVCTGIFTMLGFPHGNTHRKLSSAPLRCCSRGRYCNRHQTPPPHHHHHPTPNTQRCRTTSTLISALVVYAIVVSANCLHLGAVLSMMDGCWKRVKGFRGIDSWFLLSNWEKIYVALFLFVWACGWFYRKWQSPTAQENIIVLGNLHPRKRGCVKQNLF